MPNFLTAAQLRVVIRHAYRDLASEKSFTFKGKIKISMGNCLKKLGLGRSKNLEGQVTTKNICKEKSLLLLWSKSEELIPHYPTVPTVLDLTRSDAAPASLQCEHLQAVTNFTVLEF